MTRFEELLQAVPFTPQQERATGFLPPMMRCVGHLLYVMTAIGDETEEVGWRDAVREEMTHAKLHWEERRIDAFALSLATLQAADELQELLGEAIINLESWDIERARTNIRHIADRFIQWTVRLDREVLGIRNSDAGFSL